MWAKVLGTVAVWLLIPVIQGNNTDFQIRIVFKMFRDFNPNRVSKNVLGRPSFCLKKLKFVDVSPLSRRFLQL